MSWAPLTRRFGTWVAGESAQRHMRRRGARAAVDDAIGG